MRLSTEIKTISMGAEEKNEGWKEVGGDKSDKSQKIETPIQNSYSFWYMKRNTGGAKNANVQESYEKSIKELGSFQTVQGFWKIYNHLVRPNDLPNTMDYHLFKTGIKPMWEDSANRRGGKWMVRLRKGIASRYWEDLLLAIIGEQFDVGNEICGAVISVRFSEDIISLWNRNADNNEACYRIRDTMRKILNLPQFVTLEYKRHDTSLTDSSSFRNTSVWKGNNGSGPRHSKDGSSGSNGSSRYSRDNKFSGDKSSTSMGPSKNVWGRGEKKDNADEDQKKDHGGSKTKNK